MHKVYYYYYQAHIGQQEGSILYLSSINVLKFLLIGKTLLARVICIFRVNLYI